jgi:hypothetical protein
MTSNPQSRALPVELDRQLVALYRGWDALEKSQYQNQVVDFDLAQPEEFLPVSSREQVLANLQQIETEVKHARAPDSDLVLARLRASATYLRALLGDAIAFRPYVENTLGIRPHFFSEDEIRVVESRVETLLDSRYQLSFRPEDFPLFKTRFPMLRRDELRSQFESFRAKWLPVLTAHIRVPLEDYMVSIGFGQEDAYWKNWVSGDLSQRFIKLIVNLHPRHRWYQGYPETLVIHEFCGHVVQMINWHKRIQDGELPQFYGILTVHFPDQFLLEGLAESLPYLLPTETTQLESASVVLRELHYHALLVMNNVHILANEEGITAARAYAINNLPFTERSVLEKEIENRTRNPLFRCYQYVYGVAKDAFLKACSDLDDQERWALLRSVYDQPMTAEEFGKARASMAAKNVTGSFFAASKELRASASNRGGLKWRT